MMVWRPPLWMRVIARLHLAWSVSTGMARQMFHADHSLLTVMYVSVGYFVLILALKPFCRFVLAITRRYGTPEELHGVQRMVAELTPLLW